MDRDLNKLPSVDFSKKLNLLGPLKLAQNVRYAFDWGYLSLKFHSSFKPYRAPSIPNLVNSQTSERSVIIALLTHSVRVFDLGLVLRDRVISLIDFDPLDR